MDGFTAMYKEIIPSELCGLSVNQKTVHKVKQCYAGKMKWVLEVEMCVSNIIYCIHVLNYQRIKKT